jgi:hypothetical protein
MLGIKSGFEIVPQLTQTHGLAGSAGSLAKNVIASQGKMLWAFLWRELNARGKPIAASDDASFVVAGT